MLFPVLVRSFVDVSRAPSVLALPVILPILEFALILVGLGLEAAVSLKLAVEEVAIEYVARVEDDLSLAVLEVVDETALVNVESAFLQPSLALILLVLELSLVDFALVSGNVLSVDELVVFEMAPVNGAVLGEDSLSKGVIVEPFSVVGGAIAPGVLAAAVLLIFRKVALVSFVIGIGDSDFSVGDGLYFGEILFLFGREVEGFVAGIGETDVLAVALGGGLSAGLQLLESVALFAERIIPHLQKQLISAQVTTNH